MIKHVEGKNLDPDKGHLEITAGWGRNNQGKTQPGKGKSDGRGYTDEERQAIIEATEVRNMARRLAAILLLAPALNENYLNTKESAYLWPETD